MAKRKSRSKFPGRPNVTVGEQAMRIFPSKDGANIKDVPEEQQGLSKEEVETRGYSELTISIKIPQGIKRPFHPVADLQMKLDGWFIHGIGGMEIKGHPPFVEFSITDPDKFYASINNGGFFWSEGIVFSQILYKKIYPPISCADCEKGKRTIELGGLCSNPLCDSASPYIRANYLEQEANILREAKERGIPVTQLVEEKVAEEMRDRAERKAKENAAESEPDGNESDSPADVSEDNGEGEPDNSVVESDA